MGVTLGNKDKARLYRPMADINVTPFVDVMLVLLIIFMVTAPMLATGLKVTLPQAKQAAALKPNELIVVSIAKDGRLSVGGDEVERPALIEAVRGKMSGDEARVIHLRGDKDTPFGAVVAVLDLLAANGITRIAIGAQREALPAALAAPAEPATGGP